MSNIYDDPNVIAAMKDGRLPHDICVINCPSCGKWNYYNQGSRFYCRYCDESYPAPVEDMDGMTTLDDLINDRAD